MTPRTTVKDGMKTAGHIGSRYAAGLGLVAACLLAMPALPARAADPEPPSPAARARDPRSAEGVPPELEEVGLEDTTGAALPLDVTLVDENGRTVTLAEYYDGSKPVLLTLAYYSCPMLCTLVLNAVNDGLRELAWNLGREYRVITVSIDPNDTPEVAKEKKANYLKAYGRYADESAWTFLSGTETEVKRLADAIGFRYAWDETTQQYAHAAAAYVTTPTGTVSRILSGLSYSGNTLRLSLAEAADGKVGSALERVLLFCFHYDPASQSYVLAAQRLMTAGAVLTVVILAAWLLPWWRRERQRSAAA